MLVLLGQAEASSPASGFERGSIHSVVAIVNASHPIDAEKLVADELVRSSLFNFVVKSIKRVAMWRSILPNAQGRVFRQALRNGHVINVFEKDNREES